MSLKHNLNVLTNVFPLAYIMNIIFCFISRSSLKCKHTERYMVTVQQCGDIDSRKLLNTERNVLN